MEEKRIFDCKDESEVEDFLDKNKTLVSHESYCNIINSFFFHINTNSPLSSNFTTYFKPHSVHIAP